MPGKFEPKFIPDKKAKKARKRAREKCWSKWQYDSFEGAAGAVRKMTRQKKTKQA